MYRFILFLLACGMLQAQTVKTYQHNCTDGKERPFVVYAPKGETSKPKPLLVFLHGAIANPQLNADPEKYVQKSPLLPLAEAADCYMLFPFGQKGATWFDAVGTQMVNDEIAAVKKRYKIDENKVFLSGFSDGGSGVYYFAMTQPEPFAGFIALNGSMKVADMLGEEELFIGNTLQKPFYIVNTTADMLYPLDQITPSIDLLKNTNPNVTFHTPEGNHFMSYIDKELSALTDFIKREQRQPLTHIVWETSSRLPQQIGWLTISGVDTLSAPASWHTPAENARIWNRKADLGLKGGRFTGKGILVEAFKNDTATAKKLGVKQGDLIIALERDSINSPFTQMMYTAKKHAGDSTAIIVLRDDKPLTLKGTFNAGYPYKLFNHKRPSAKIEAKIEGKELYVRTSRVVKYEIDKKRTPVKIKGKIKDLKVSSTTK